ncbi:hypothetical protein I2483_18440 [Sporosarcina sp. E16_3]|nr:hypothetical protein [Sporosarcina sp. E16_8]MBO0603645.1 hypothetical protein [Sporosarcina sp. E16_3]
MVSSLAPLMLKTLLYAFWSTPLLTFSLLFYIIKNIQYPVN